jgi:Holliday junction resolvasome RuvABC DNA-binding subunit
VLCSAHNAHTARQAFGEDFIAEKRRGSAARDEPKAPETEPLPDAFAKALSTLCKLGFRRRDAESAIATIRREHVAPELEPLLRAALGILTPARA